MLTSCAARAQCLCLPWTGDAGINPEEPRPVCSASARRRALEFNADSRKECAFAHPRRKSMLRFIARILMLFAIAAAPALAQTYPSKVITLLVPFAAGGPTDVVARSLAQSMGKALNQTIIVENAVGAGGTIAPTKPKNRNPEVYTLV